MFQQKLPSVYEDQNKTLSQESLVLHLIYQNDIDSLKDIGTLNCNLNFLESYSEVEIDSKITPLICACFLGRLEIVKMFLNNPSIDVDMASEESKQTPLTISASTSNYEIMKMLLDYGAEVNKPNVFHQTPLICCFSRLDEDKNVFENRKICFKMAELLLHCGADIDWIVDKTKGYTMLMQVCSIKMEMSQKETEVNYCLIKFLIENGARKNLKSMKNKTLIDLSNKHKNKEKVQDLLCTAKQIYFYNQRPQLQIRQPIPQEKPIQFEEYKQKKWFDYLPFYGK